jgi:diguanylate cyclase (GGDEF)-like protein
LFSACGAVSVVLSAPRSAYAEAGGTAVDFSTAWVLPMAILLPSVYAAVAPVILIAIMYYFVRRGVVKMSDPGMRIWPMELNRDVLLGGVRRDRPRRAHYRRGRAEPKARGDRATDRTAGPPVPHPPGSCRAVPGIRKTGLLNVSTWKAEAEAELTRAVRSGHPVALVLIDIDHFKLVNDTYAHLVGDRVLQAIAEAMTGQSRSCDRPGRFRGEECVLLLAQTGEQDACKIAERLRGYIAAPQIPADDRPEAPMLNVTVSAGVTALEAGDVYQLADLLAAADSAMYAAKQAGRNQAIRRSCAGSRGLAALPQGRGTVALEFVAVCPAPGHCHGQRQGGAGHERPGAGVEGSVGRGEA